jgi:hypothetical protein
MIVPQFEERVKDKKTKLLNRERLGVELISLINDPSFSDIAFTFLNDFSTPFSSSPRKLYAHKAIVSARSTYFANMFRWETKSHELSATKQDLSKRQEIAVGCTFEALHSVLQFIYGGRSQGEGIVNGENVVELFELSNQYNLYGLKGTCEEVLIEGLDIENVLSLLRL